MKKLVLVLMLLVGVSTIQAQLKIGGRSIDTRKLGKAAEEVAKAVTLSDADVVALCKEAIDWMDEHNPIADETTEYGARLARLTQNIKSVNGLPLNFKVYHVIDINAFACGDGSIRVFSSLMDLMDDDELMAIIGHEIGHIAGTDVKDAIKNAYLTSAAINAAGAASKTVSKLSDTQLRELTESFVGARFSQKQEYAADDYGFKTCVENGFSPYGMANALSKLVELSQGAKASAVQQMFSSHPDSEKRAERMRARAEEAEKEVKR
jgi:putative metalloprotease